MESPNSKIKDVYIELDNFQFDHGPYDSEQSTKKRVGRVALRDRLKMLLNSESKSGTYLLTGFRGMGKTSEVKRVVSSINKEFEKKIGLNKSKIQKKSQTMRIFKIFLLIQFILVPFFLNLNIPGSFESKIACYLIVFTILTVIHALANNDGKNKINEALKNKEKVSYIKQDTILIFFKLISIITLCTIIFLFFVFPRDFCDIKGLHFFCFESNFATFFIKISKFKWFAAAIAILTCYVILSFVYFIHDFLYLHFNKQSLSQPPIKEFWINLSQDNISDRDVLKRINDNLLEYWESEEGSLNVSQFTRTIYKPWLFINRVLSIGKDFDLNTYSRIRIKLKALRRRLEGTVTIKEESGTDPGWATTFGKGLSELTMPLGKIKDSQTISYPIASAKEAEDELKLIIKEINLYFKNQLSKSSGKEKSSTHFLFIVDELDKIEPESNSLLDEREFSNPSLDQNINIPGTREYRKRQEAVARLLANLKGFLTQVEAKFIFIGGRELFDADLADIADRDSFYSSIFHDVIYLESFYKDKGNKDKGNKDIGAGDEVFKYRKGITNLTEEYLIKLIDNNATNLKELRTNNKLTINENLFKVFHLLQNYIIYLTHRSTGSPKKLRSLIEHLIVTKDCKELDKHLCLYQWELKGTESQTKSPSFYLRFNYTTQYEINFTADLLRPYLIQNSRFLKDLGDRLLFSTPFIFDHIIKFYPFGFSWRNLELIPEVVVVSKEPYLREHIKAIHKYLCNYHIKQSISGLFDFKFHSIIRKELSILTKKSDLASAAFNFTLDESLLVKRHYKKKLIELRNKYKDFVPLEGDNQFVHSISFVQTILGDLYFYDKEYDEALLYYTESIQTLRLPNGIDDRFLTRHQFLIWQRNKLKIGLTLEKMEGHDSAISIYRTLMIDSERYLQRIVNTDIQESKSIRVEGGTLLIADKEEIEGNDPRSENHRNMHLIILPFISHLAAIEKYRVDGIDYSNLYKNKEELKRILNPKYNLDYLKTYNENGEKVSSLNSGYLLIDDYRKAWLWADYLSNVGSILFYKNCQFTRFFTPNITKSIVDLKMCNKYDVHIDKKAREYETDSEYEQDLSFESKRGCGKYKKTFDTRFFIKTDFPKLFSLLHIQANKYKLAVNHTDYYPSLTSIAYYWEAVFELTKNQSQRMYNKVDHKVKGKKVNEINPIQYAAFYLTPDLGDMINNKRMYYLGSIVGKLGDSIFASLKKGDDLKNIFSDYSQYPSFADLIKYRDKNSHLLFDFVLEELSTDNLFTIRKVLCIYTLSANLFKRAGQNFYYTSSLKKILIVFMESISKNSFINKLDKSQREGLKKIYQDLTMDIIKSSGWYNNFTNRAQINKYRDVLNLYSKKETAKENTSIYNSTANHSDGFEAINISETINMRLFKNSMESTLKPTDIVRNNFVRLSQLKYHIEWNYNKVIDELGSNDVFTKVGTVDFKGKQNYYLDFVFDALFALRESIKIIQMYDPGFTISYSYLGTAHHWAGNWCLFLKNLKSSLDDSRQKELEKNLLELLGRSSTYFLEYKYQFEMAISNYYKVLQMHSEGKAYKDNLCDLYSLEDDYNDSLSHFNLALERNLVNSGEIRERIDKLKKLIKGSELWVYENYTTYN